jgi:transposase
MQLFVGMDVSQRLTHLCVVDAAGKRIWRGKCATDPLLLAIREHASAEARVGIETGPLTPWLVHALRALNVEVTCIEARHAHAVMTAA